MKTFKSALPSLLILMFSANLSALYAQALPTSFSWGSTGPLIAPKSDSTHNMIAVKDPSTVFYNGQYIVYASSVNSAGNYGMEYLHFTNWSTAGAATPYFMDNTPGFSGYHTAPQVFYFAPQNKWYLIFQSGQPQYSTNSDPTQPQNWTTPKNFFASQPSSVSNWIDFWIISDSSNVYLFFCGDNGNFYRSSTSLANFPNGFNTPVIVYSDSEFNLFEADNVYTVENGGGYLANIECIGSDGHRFFRALSATSLGGTWTSLGNTANLNSPFLGAHNVTFNSGVANWTSDFSSGGAVIDGYDSTDSINLSNLTFLYQGDNPNNGASSYNLIPWSLGLASSKANTTVPTATRTNTPVPPTATKTNTPVPPTPTKTNTPVPPTATKTNTPVPPTATATVTATKTNTPVPPTATATVTSTKTATAVPPTATNTLVPPTATKTNTPVPPTSTATAVPPTATFTATAVPPTATNTLIPPTATKTNTPVPPTGTATAVPPTATFTATAMPPSATPTVVPPTGTPTVVLTNTATSVPPTATLTNTPVPPTATHTAVPPTFTSTPLPPTATFSATKTVTLVPPTATHTAVPPTATNTPVPPTATFTLTPAPPTATPTVATGTGSFKVQLLSGITSDSTNSPHPQLQIVNTGTGPLSLNNVTLRYWFNCDCTGQAIQTWVDWAGLIPSGQNVTSDIKVSVVPTSQGGQTDYALYTFTGNLVLQPGQSLQIQSRFNKNDWSNMLQDNDWSYEANTAFADDLKVTGYVNNGLVWGSEPTATAAPALQVTSAVAYPNPSAGSGTTLDFTLSGGNAGQVLTDSSAKITLTVYTTASRLIWSETLPAGTYGTTGQHDVYWNEKDLSGNGMSNGVYYLKVTVISNGKTTTSIARILILK